MSQADCDSAGDGGHSDGDHGIDSNSNSFYESRSRSRSRDGDHGDNDFRSYNYDYDHDELERKSDDVHVDINGDINHDHINDGVACGQCGIGEYRRNKGGGFCGECGQILGYSKAMYQCNRVTCNEQKCLSCYNALRNQRIL